MFRNFIILYYYFVAELAENVADPRSVICSRAGLRRSNELERSSRNTALSQSDRTDGGGSDALNEPEQVLNQHLPLPAQTTNTFALQHFGFDTQKVVAEHLRPVDDRLRVCLSRICEMNWAMHVVRRRIRFAPGFARPIVTTTHQPQGPDEVPNLRTGPHLLRPLAAADAAAAARLLAPVEPAAYTDRGAQDRRLLRGVRERDAALRQAGLGPARRPRWSGQPVPIREEIVKSTPFCDLLHFDRDEKVVGKRYDPKVLLVAPMSGHYATLLRGTVEAMIQEHNLYITDWRDARDIPAWLGALRPRRLHRPHHRLHPLPRHQHPRHRRLPALGAGAGRDRADGGHGRSLPPGLDHADGRPDRHAPQPDRGQRARPVARASSGSSRTSSSTCRGRTPASCAGSIRASSSSPAS